MPWVHGQGITRHSRSERQMKKPESKLEKKLDWMKRKKGCSVRAKARERDAQSLSIFSRQSGKATCRSHVAHMQGPVWDMTLDLNRTWFFVFNRVGTRKNTSLAEKGYKKWDNSQFRHFTILNG